MSPRTLAGVRLVAAVSLSCLAVTPALADSPLCPKEAGVGGPYVPSRRVAVAIFRAIADAIAPNQVRTHPFILVDDEGDHWSVWRKHRAPARAAKANEVIVTAGGGGLGMSIDKCTGTVSAVAFSR